MCKICVFLPKAAEENGISPDVVMHPGTEPDIEIGLRSFCEDPPLDTKR